MVTDIQKVGQFYRQE